jgi:hypothetical protein
MRKLSPLPFKFEGALKFESYSRSPADSWSSFFWLRPSNLILRAQVSDGIALVNWTGGVYELAAPAPPVTSLTNVIKSTLTIPYHCAENTKNEPLSKHLSN